MIYNFIKIIINKNEANQRIDKFLFKKFKKISAKFINRFIRSFFIKINLKIITNLYIIKHKDIIYIPLIENFNIYKKKIYFKLNIIYEDRYLLIINKNNNIAVHGGSKVLFSFIEQIRLIFSLKLYLELVHRIDKNTSGILILAKNYLVLLNLHKQIYKRYFKRYYLTCVYGNWNKTWCKKILIDTPIIKNKIKNKLFFKKINYKSSTIIEFLKNWNKYILLKIEPKTGRLHQIRYHLSEFGLNILGDNKYGNFIINKIIYSKYIWFNFMFLHAFYIKIIHPFTKKLLKIKLPLQKNYIKFLKFFYR